MIEILLLLAFNSLVCYGFFNATIYQKEDTKYYKDGLMYDKTIYHKGILWFIPYLFDNSKWYIKKPLYDCMPCMASVHSLYVYWWYFSFSMDSLLAYPIYILALAGLNSIINDITE